MAEHTISKVPKIRFKGFFGGWEERNIESICSISTGKSNTQDRVADGVYPFYVRSAVVERSNRYLYDEEAVLTVGDGVGTGKVYHYVNGKYDLHQRVYRMHSFAKCVDAVFFYHFFANHFHKRVMAMTAKTSVDSVRMEMIAEMDFRHSSKPEQTKVGGYFRELDRLIGLHQRKHVKLVTLKKAMLQKMFPQPGTTAPEIRFKGFEGAWVENEFKNIASRSTQSAPEDHLPRIEYEDIISGSGRLNKDLLKKGSRKVGVNFDEGDVLFGKLRPYLKNWWFAKFAGIAVGDFWVFKSAAATSDFIYCLIQTEAFERIANQSAGSKMPRSDWKLVSNSVFRIPLHIVEQQKIGTYFRTLDDLISKHALQLEKLKQIKSACLEKMFV